MPALAYIARSASLAAVAVAAAMSFDFKHRASRVKLTAGTPYNDTIAMIDPVTELTVEWHGGIPAGLAVGVQGATSITPSVSGATNGCAWAAGSAISLGTMVVTEVSAQIGEDGRYACRATLESVGAPSFVTAT